MNQDFSKFQIAIWCRYSSSFEDGLKKILGLFAANVAGTDIVWGRYYFDTFIDKAKKGEIFKGNKILNKNSGKIGFDTFRLKLVESNWTLIPFLHDFDEVLG